MSRISRDIYTSLDVNGPYLRIDTQPTSTIVNHTNNGTFTIVASTYYLTGDEAEIGNIDVLETDAVAPTDAILDNQTPGVPHTAKVDGHISYQWYEVSVDPRDQSETINKLTDGVLYTGTTTPTLNVINAISPGYHLNRYYCELDFIPNLTNGQYDTGNAINDILKSDEATLNVRPFIILNTQPLSDTVIINTTDDVSVSTQASLSDTRFPWDDYRLQYQWWEKDKLNQGSVPDIRLVDGDFSTFINQNRIEETILNRIQTTTQTISVGVNDGNTIVGIPTETVEVSVTVIGAGAGGGGDEDATYRGGAGGKGRVGEFKFSDAEINYINNAGTRSDYLLIAGSSGDTGRTGNAGTGGNGGIGAEPFAVNSNISAIRGGAGGDAGPGGSSGGGGGGGSASGIAKYTSDGGRVVGQWAAIAGAGGGGGGASKEASGNAGGNALDWEEFDTSLGDISPVEEATAVNYNPIAGTEQASYTQDRIDYGFYVKTSSQTSTLNTTTTYDRVVVIWNHRHVVNQSNVKLNSDSIGTYIESGNVKYYASTHRGSLLGWCNDDSQDKICLIDGGYTNSFNVFRQSNVVVEGLSAYRGANGADKIIGDGGGGGGAGGGAHSPAVGGSVGSDPVPSDEVDITFVAVTSLSNSLLRGKYIKFYETSPDSWYGFPEAEPARSPVVTIDIGTIGGFSLNAKLKPNTTYDVVTHFEGGRTSDLLKILQDLTLTANNRDTDTIFGRTIGMNADGDEGTDEAIFRDIVVSASDGSFDYYPETVRMDDGEIVGRAIIRYTTPPSVRNSVTATGGNGGRSEYDSQIFDLVTNGNYGLNNSANGRVDLTYKTEQPYNIIEEETIRIRRETNYSVRGSSALEVSGYTSTLTMRSNYVFSKRILAQITAINTATNTVALTSGPDTIYTNIVDVTFSDDRDNSIVVEQIRHNDNFAVLSNINLLNGDLIFEKSNVANEKEVQYYSFYSNQDIEVDVKMYGGKGNDVGGYSGGEGGFSYLRLNMKANTEYVIAGLNDFVNAPFLFKKSRLLACVGGGGDANTNGRGGRGGGVTINGEDAPFGGSGGIAPTTLSENGILGSASIRSIFPISGDTQASIPDGGVTVRCSKGNPIPGGLSPCTDRSGNTKFKIAGGADVTNTKEISRGFKAGYNLFYTAGRNNGAIINQGWGGSGATGGQGSDSYGGGGGSGYIIPDLTTDIFARSEEQSNQDGTDPITSTLGGSTGPARVVISRAEIPSSVLPGFIERPAEPDRDIRETGGLVDFVYEPLPETIAPPLVDPPIPSMSITKIESTGFTGGTQTFTPPYNTKISVLEKGQLNVYVRTQHIPAGTTFYWQIVNKHLNAEFDHTNGSFTTTSSGGEVVGNFTIHPTENNRTDFIAGTLNWKVNIYTDRLFNYKIASSHAEGFRSLDTSLTAPSATFSGLLADQTRGERIRNSINEASSQTISISTLDIKNGETIYWKLLNSAGSPITATTTPSTSDFGGSIVSGTATVSSNFSVDADDTAIWNGLGVLANANQGSASFVIAATDDVITEGEESFGLQLEYPSGTVITRTVGTLVGEVKKSIKINDTSIDPEASFTGNSSVDEGSTLTVTVNTVYLREGDNVYWKIFKSDNTEVDTADFVDGIIDGYGTVGPTGGTAPARTGSFTVSINPANDGSTEGTESFKLKVYRDIDRTDPLHVPGTTNAAEFSFDVIDTSLSPIEYEVFHPRVWQEDGDAREIKFRVLNLRRETASDVGTERDPTYYWRIYDSDDYPAIGREEIIGDGYIKHFSAHEGSFKTAYKLDRARDGGTPVHEKIFPITPEKDYLTGENGDFTIKFFDDKDEFDRDGTPIYVSSTKGEGTFELQDTSKNIIKFRKEYGFGVPGTNTFETINSYQSYNVPSGTQPDIPQINESGGWYSFRIETSAQAGTEFTYDLVTPDNGFDVTDDFESFYEGDLPASKRGFYDIGGNSDLYFDGTFGIITTMARSSSENSDITVEEGIRSVAFIYVRPKADRSALGDNKEGTETFKLRVFDEALSPYADNSSKTPVIEQQFNVADTSVKDAAPSVDVDVVYSRGDGVDEVQITRSPPNTAEPNLTEYTIEDTPGAKFSINFDLSGGVATAGTLSGDGFSDSSYDYFNGDRAPTAPTTPGKEWYVIDQTQTSLFNSPVNAGANRTTIDYLITVSNEEGRQSFTRTLRINWIPAREYWEAVPIFRYVRGNQRVHQLNGPTDEDGKPNVELTRYRYCVTTFGPSNDMGDNADWRDYSSDRGQTARERWGEGLLIEMTQRGITVTPKGILGPYYIGRRDYNENRSNLLFEWRLEGLLGYAFKVKPGQSPPNGTHSIRSLFQVSGKVQDNGREYFGWDLDADDYYIWHEDEIPTEVPDEILANQVKVGIAKPSSEYHFLLVDASDGRLANDRNNYFEIGGEEFVLTPGVDNLDGRIGHYNCNDNSITIRVYKVGRTPIPNLLSSDYHNRAEWLPGGSNTLYVPLSIPGYQFRSGGTVKSNLFRMPKSGRHGWVQ